MYKTQKTIPTLLGLFLIVFGIGILSFGGKQISSLVSLADPSQKPQNITVTNISDSSFSVSWTTQKETPGVILAKEGSHTLAFLDDLDSDGISRNRRLHHVTLKDLQVKTSYTSYIQSGTATCNQFITCPSITQTTLEKISKVSPEGPMYGTVLNKNNQPLSGALIYVAINLSTSLSTRSDRLGKWVIPLIVIGKDGNALSDSDQIQITAFSSPHDSGTTSLDGSLLHKNREIPPIIIGTSGTRKLSLNTFGPLAQNKNNLNVLGNSSTSPDKTNKVEIYFPQKDNDTTIDPRPRIRGSGIPGVPLSLTLRSITQTGRVIPDSEGRWEWRPQKPLSVGLHTLLVQSYDAKKKVTSVSRKFFVLKSGESVLGDSTPSASLTPGPSDTPTPETTESVTPVPSITGSLSLTPTLTPTPTETPTPTPTSTLTPSPTAIPTPEATGNTIPTVALITSGIALFALGAKFLLFP